MIFIRTVLLLERSQFYLSNKTFLTDPTRYAVIRECNAYLNYFSRAPGNAPEFYRSPLTVNQCDRSPRTKKWQQTFNRSRMLRLKCTLPGDSNPQKIKWRQEEEQPRRSFHQKVAILALNAAYRGRGEKVTPSLSQCPQRLTAEQCHMMTKHVRARKQMERLWRRPTAKWDGFSLAGLPLK